MKSLWLPGCQSATAFQKKKKKKKTHDKHDKSTTFKTTVLHYTFLLTQIKAQSDELIYSRRITVINYMQCTFEQISLNDLRFCHEVVFAAEVIKY